MVNVFSIFGIVPIHFTDIDFVLCHVSSISGKQFSCLFLPRIENYTIQRIPKSSMGAQKFYRNLLLKSNFLGFLLISSIVFVANFSGIRGVFSNLPRVFLEKDKARFDEFKEKYGSLDKFLGTENNSESFDDGQLHLKRDRQFDRVIPANLTDGKRARCVAFSCASPGYWLVEENLAANRVEECDRVHFAVHTYNSKGEEVASTWCRVPILRNIRAYLPNYQRILYIDSDIIYREPEIMKTDCETERPALIISTKPTEVKNGGNAVMLREMQMNWFLLCRPDDPQSKILFSKWDLAYRNVHMQDQTVFNEVWNCNSPYNGIKCVKNSFDNAILVFHCGGYLPRYLRYRCMHKNF